MSMYLLQPRTVNTRAVFLSHRADGDLFNIEPEQDTLGVRHLKRNHVTRYYSYPWLLPVTYDSATGEFRDTATRELIDVDPAALKAHAYADLESARQTLALYSLKGDGADEPRVISMPTDVPPNVVSVTTVEYHPTDLLRFDAPARSASEPAKPNAMSFATDLRLGPRAFGALGATEKRPYAMVRPNAPGGLLLRRTLGGVAAVPEDGAGMQAAFAGLEPPNEYTPAPFLNIYDWAGNQPTLRLTEMTFVLSSPATFTFEGGAVTFAWDFTPTASLEVFVDGALVLGYYRHQMTLSETVALSAGAHTIVTRTVHTGYLSNVYVEYIANAGAANEVRNLFLNDTLLARRPDIEYGPTERDSPNEVRTVVTACVHRLVQTLPDQGTLWTTSAIHDARGNLTIALGQDSITREHRQLLQATNHSVTEESVWSACLARYNASGVLQWAIKKPFLDDTGNHFLFYTGLSPTRDQGVLAGIARSLGWQSPRVLRIADVGGAEHRLRWPTRGPYSDCDGALVKYSACGAVQWAVTIKSDSGIVYDSCETTDGSSVVFACNASSMEKFGTVEPWVIIDGAGVQHNMPERARVRLGFVKLNPTDGSLVASSQVVWGPEDKHTAMSLYFQPLGALQAFPGGGFIGHMMHGVRGSNFELSFYDPSNTLERIVTGTCPDSVLFSVQMVARYTRDMRADWVATLVCDSGRTYDSPYNYLYGERSECVVDTETGDVTVLFVSMNGLPVTITDGKGSTATVNVTAAVRATADPESDENYFGLARFSQDGELLWVRMLGQNSIADSIFLGERMMAAGPDASALVLIRRAATDASDPDLTGEMVLVHVAKDGTTAHEWPLRGVQESWTDYAENYICLSQGSANHAYVMLRNNDDWSGEDTELTAPALLGTSEPLAVPLGCTAIGLTFAEEGKQRMVIDGDLVVLGSAALPIEAPPGGLQQGSLGEGHLAPRLRRVVQRAAKTAEGYGTVRAASGASAVVAGGGALLWDPTSATGIVSRDLALNHRVSVDMNLVMSADGASFVASAAGLYAVGLRGWATAQSGADDTFQWSLVRKNGAGQVVATTSHTGASGAIIALDAGDSFSLVNGTSADVTIQATTKLSVQLLGAP